MRLTRLIASTRLVYLLFLLPPSILWATGEGSGGWLLPVTLALFAFVHLGIFDTKTLSAGHRQRLSYTRDPDAASSVITGAWATYCAIVFAICTLILLFIATRVGVLAIILALIVFPLTGGVGTEAGPTMKRRRMLWAELAHPFGFLILPAWWIGSRKIITSTDAGDGAVDISVARFPLSSEAWTITWLGALMLCAYLITCMIRDEGEDIGERQVTTPTLLGRHGATAMLLLTLVGVQILAATGTHPDAGGFSWFTPGAAALGGMLTLWAVSQHADDAAPKIALLMQIALLVSFLA